LTFGPKIENESENIPCNETKDFPTNIKASQTSEYFDPFDELLLGPKVRNQPEIMACVEKLNFATNFNILQHPSILVRSEN